MGLSQELSDLVRRNGERNPRCHFQRVDSNHFTVLQKQSQYMRTDVFMSQSDTDRNKCMCSLSRLTQHRMPLPKHVSRLIQLIKTLCYNYWLCSWSAFSKPPPKRDRHLLRGSSFIDYIYGRHNTNKTKQELTRFTKGPPEFPYWNREKVPVIKNVSVIKQFLYHRLIIFITKLHTI